MKIPLQEIERRADSLRARWGACDLCPRRCGVDRTAAPGAAGGAGVCRTGTRARVSAAYPHHGEEPELSGTRGSGTVFFAGCNLGCVFCQNPELSHRNQGDEVDDEGLADLVLALQQAGCHNLNLVTPSHVAAQILGALALATRRGFSLPVVWNTSSYDRVDTLAAFDGIVDLYLPDLKFVSRDPSARLLTASDYPDVARAAIREMHRQVGDLVVDADGIARRGLLVRHLVMPGAIADATAGFRFLASVAPGTAVNVMDQYRPLADAMQFPGIDRRATAAEVEAAREAARGAGLRVL